MLRLCRRQPRKRPPHLAGRLLGETGDADVADAVVAIQQEILRSQDSRYDHRLHGVLLVCQGMDCYEVADCLGQDPVTVQRWIHQFNAHGFAGLEEGDRPGRPPRIPPPVIKKLQMHLRQSPRDLGYTQNLWDGKLLSYHLDQRFEICLGVRQCQRLFRSLGFRLRKPRPKSDGGNPVAQAAYKKTSSPRPRSKP